MTWTVELWDAAANAWQYQNKVQNVNLATGRRFLTDPYAADKASYSGHISNNHPDLAVMGNPIRLKYKAQLTWVGTITDVSVEYGIVQNADYITVAAEGILAKFGRAYVTGLSLSSSSISTQLAALAAEVGVTIDIFGTMGSLASTQTYTGNALDLLNLLMLTEYGHIYQTSDQIDFYTRQSWGDTATLYNFTDSTLGSYGVRYTQLEFDSAAENYFTRVVVQPEGLAEQVSDAGIDPPRTYIVSTLDYSTSQAYNHALYLRNNFDTPAQTIAAITCVDTGQTNDVLGTIAQGARGQQIDVKFRGSTYVCIIEGVTMSGSPEQTRFTFHVSPQDMNAYLRLNDPVFGTLDSNKLGF